MDPSRRHVLQALVTGAVGIAAGAAARGATPPTPKAVVASSRRRGKSVGGAGDGPGPAPLLAAAIAAAVGEKGPVEAMRRLFKSEDVIGVKVNSLAGRGLAPDPSGIEALVGWLGEAGVPGRNVVIFDRSDRELSRAGFTLRRNGSGSRCFGINDDYDWTPLEWGPGGSCFARLLRRDLTALINVGVLKDHDLAGVSLGLKNWYGVIHNPNKHHDEGCNPYIAHLAAFPLIQRKLKLTIIDGLTAQCQGGPARQPRHAWPWGGYLASTDPVAVDAVGWKILEDRRREVGLPTLADDKREPRYIASAAKLGLGESDLARIRVVET